MKFGNEICMNFLQNEFHLKFPAINLAVVRDGGPSNRRKSPLDPRKRALRNLVNLQSGESSSLTVVACSVQLISRATSNRLPD